jgi:hypothetical protein
MLPPSSGQAVSLGVEQVVEVLFDGVADDGVEVLIDRVAVGLEAQDCRVRRLFA